jgi:hypothetical protein
VNLRCFIASLAIAPLVAACRPSGPFHCELDQQCRRGSTFGFCEAPGYCSFTDGDCASSHRYDDTAGENLAGQCVPLAFDGGVDSAATTDAKTWSCGIKPAAPAATVTHDKVENGQHEIIALSDTTVNGAAVIEVSPGTQLMISTQFSLVDCICPGCIDQIEIGLVPGPRLACIYDANPQVDMPCETPTTGMALVSKTAPLTAGLYELRFGIGQDFGCMFHPSWWQGTIPTPDTTVAYVCVR